LILFAGGDGALGLTGASSMKSLAANFLVRSRDMFVAHGFAVAVVDTPSDRKSGMNGVFRMSAAHATDVEAVAADLKKRFGAPVWLVGTSMGTFSAAGAAIAAKGIDGLVLTSSITQSRPDWKIARSHRDGVASMRLAQIAVPTLIVSHRHDGCELTPAAGAQKLRRRLTRAKKVEVAILEGGARPASEPCQAKSQHGYYGIETQAVDAIAKFIKANSK
jgi:pimeloyl-ACP methyl ester carboxylesterase